MLERWRGGGGRTRTAASIQQYSHAFNTGFWRALVPPFFLPSPLTRDCKAAPLCERVSWERVHPHIQNCALTSETTPPHQSGALTSKLRAHIRKSFFYPKLRAHIRSSQNSALTSEAARSQLKLLAPKTTRSHLRLRVPSASIHRTAPYHALLHSELYSVVCGPR